jgi:hypothetical protein
LCLQQGVEGDRVEGENSAHARKGEEDSMACSRSRSLDGRQAQARLAARAYRSRPARASPGVGQRHRCAQDALAAAGHILQQGARRPGRKHEGEGVQTGR